MHNPNLWKLILAGMVLGGLFGFVLSPAGLGLIADQERAGMIAGWVALPGIIFLSVIMMVILPLVATSIILGVAGSGNVGFVKRMGLRLVPYFLITAFVAIMMGIGLVSVIKPGVLAGGGGALAVTEDVAVQTFEGLTIPDRIANLIPRNPLKAALELDLLPIVIASIIAGMAVLSLKPDTMGPFIRLCESVQLVTMKIIEWAMMIAPVAVFALIADIMIRTGPGVFAGLGGYMATVLLGLACVALMYALILVVLARQSPLEILMKSKEALLLAFSTSSSSATMPVTLRVAKEKLKADEDVVQLVIPLGTVINMDGTGIYQAIAAVFLCQLAGIELSMAQMFLLALTTVGASIGTPSTPGVGIVILATIVAGLGVPPAGIALILGVDRILDMCRTTVNVAGDLVAVCVMERWMHRRVRARGVTPSSI